jgi:hypothetical protein
VLFFQRTLMLTKMKWDQQACCICCSLCVLSLLCLGSKHCKKAEHSGHRVSLRWPCKKNRVQA